MLSAQAGFVAVNSSASKAPSVVSRKPQKPLEDNPSQCRHQLEKQPEDRLEQAGALASAGAVLGPQATSSASRKATCVPDRDNIDVCTAPGDHTRPLRQFRPHVCLRALQHLMESYPGPLQLLLFIEMFPFQQSDTRRRL